MGKNNIIVICNVEHDIVLGVCAFCERDSLRAEVSAGAHLVATVGDKNRELEIRLALAESELKKLRGEPE